MTIIQEMNKYPPVSICDTTEKFIKCALALASMTEFCKDEARGYIRETFGIEDAVTIPDYADKCPSDRYRYYLLWLIQTFAENDVLRLYVMERVYLATFCYSVENLYAEWCNFHKELWEVVAGKCRVFSVPNPDSAELEPNSLFIKTVGICNQAGHRVWSFPNKVLDVIQKESCTVDEIDASIIADTYVSYLGDMGISEGSLNLEWKLMYAAVIDVLCNKEIPYYLSPYYGAIGFSLGKYPWHEKLEEALFEVLEREVKHEEKIPEKVMQHWGDFRKATTAQLGEAYEWYSYFVEGRPVSGSSVNAVFDLVTNKF